MNDDKERVKELSVFYLKYVVMFMTKCQNWHKSEKKTKKSVIARLYSQKERKTYANLLRTKRITQSSADPPK
jgi:hypothetical protein